MFPTKGSYNPDYCKKTEQPALSCRTEKVPQAKKKINSATPTVKNRRATHDYFIEERYEAGLVLRGWEVKSVRAGRATINQSHIDIRNGEMWMWNAHFTPADQICTHETPELSRPRKLLMHKKEIFKIMGKVDRAGYTLVPLDLHFVRGRVKLSFALARGKREYEKRADESKKEWKREQGRLLRNEKVGGKYRQNFTD